MRDFSKVSPLLWRDNRFRSLATVDAQLAFLFFITCEHQNSAGCYRLPEGYAAVDLRWEVDRYRKARAAVVDAGLLISDDITDELFIAGWFETNPAMNSKHALGVKRQISLMKSDTVREAAEEQFLKAEEERTSRPANSGTENVHPISGRLADTSYMSRRSR